MDTCTPTRHILFICLLFNLHLSSIDSCETYQFVPSESQTLEGHVIKTVSRSLVNLCWNDCVWLSWCLSINARPTNHGTFECDLNNSSKRANPGHLVSRQGSQYHEMKDVDDVNCAVSDCKRKEDLGDGWFRYGKAAIKYFQQLKNWTDARIFCQTVGGDLLSISSSHENDFVYDVFVKSLNLTYGEREMKFPDVYWKFNGQEQGISLYGTPNVRYEVVDEENALFFTEGNGYAEIPVVPLNPEGFTITLWVRVLCNTYQWPKIFEAYSNEGQVFRIMDIKSAHPAVEYNINGQSIGRARCPENTWCHVAVSWNKTEHLGRMVFQGSEIREKRPSLQNIRTAATRFLLGKETPSFVQTFHGYVKHLMIFNRALSIHEVQTSLYWHQQGVWIGLNNQANSQVFQWSDGTPVSQFMPLPAYNPKPVRSGRKCVAMSANRKWLDKHCLEKKSFLCEKPAP